MIDLTIANIFEADQVAAQVGRLTSLKAESWIETNAQLMNAITAQSLSTNMIIVFVAISVAFGIASVMSVSVVRRTREIGILRATGATPIANPEGFSVSGCNLWLARFSAGQHSQLWSGVGIQ